MAPGIFTADNTISPEMQFSRTALIWPVTAATFPCVWFCNLLLQNTFTYSPRENASETFRNRSRICPSVIQAERHVAVRYLPAQRFPVVHSCCKTSTCGKRGIRAGRDKVNWCAARESNPQALRRRNLNPVRLPISPAAQRRKFPYYTAGNGKINSGMRIFLCPPWSPAVSPAARRMPR